MSHELPIEAIIERLEGIRCLNEQRFAEMRSELLEIKQQTTKTNGRVSRLEGWKNRIVGGLLVLGAVMLPVFVDWLRSRFIF